MKNLRKSLQYGLAIILIMTSANAQGQLLKKLTKRAEQAAQRTVEQRVDREASKKTDAALDSILEPGSGKSPAEVPQAPEVDAGPPPPPGNSPSGVGNAPGVSNASGAKSMQVYSKFDYVPGDKQMFFDDFSNDFVGDFPSRWNTNGSGEVVTINNSPEKWLKPLPGYGIYFMPEIKSLPKEYTIEFDLLTNGLDEKTSSTAGFTVTLCDDPSFDTGKHYVYAFLPVGQFGAFDIHIKNYIDAVGSPINSGIRADLRQAMLNRPHISIAVNDQRFRLWVNETKYVDIPRFIPEGSVMNNIKFNVNNIIDGKEDIFITNVKVAEGGLDLRRTLISEGKVSTNGILFDTGSANIQPQSMGVIYQISQVLQQESGMKLLIVGHTDADGTEEANLELSKKRAEAVKDALVDVYRVSADRLATDGKGETAPVGDNATPMGKAQNRRVEFIKN